MLLLRRTQEEWIWLWLVVVCSRCSVQMLQIIETKQSLLYKVCRHSSLSVFVRGFETGASLSLLTLFAPSRFGTLGRGQMEESHFCVVVNGNFCVFGSWLLTWRLIIAFGLIQGESKILETFFVRGNLLDFEKIEFDVVPCTFVLLAFN